MTPGWYSRPTKNREEDKWRKLWKNRRVMNALERRAKESRKYMIGRVEAQQGEQMSSHQLAKTLLASPDLPVVKDDGLDGYSEITNLLDGQLPYVSEGREKIGRVLRVMDQ